jgi:hypothetical protein
MSNEPIILKPDEVEFWKAVYIADTAHGNGEDACHNADVAVHDLRRRMPEVSHFPTFPLGEEPRVVQCVVGRWDIVRGPHDEKGDYWRNGHWERSTQPGGGTYDTQDEASGVLASLSDAQRTAPVGERCES